MPRKSKIVDIGEGVEADSTEHPGKGVLLEEPDGGGLPLIQYLMRAEWYEMASKVYRFIEEGRFTPEDVENAICTGYVHKTEQDELGQAVGTKKYVIVGCDTCGYAFYTVGKIMTSDEGKFYFLITAHGEGDDYDDLPMP
ncbi:MAG TPA: hypothetical protein VE377_17480 [Candidatus Dormibacteraeota bacterium]|nr:hypothetical protein [Candidatus Dormibacteraeota bacterium]